MKIHVGCGPQVLDDWINVDIKPINDRVMFGSILELPFPDSSCTHILANYMFEHLDFLQEQRAFKECLRVLKKGGTLEIKVPDFEATVKEWLSATDEWKAFYTVCEEDDPRFGFGHGPGLGSRWGRLLTYIFGTQEAEGKFHKNAYTTSKILKQYKHLGLSIDKIDTFYDKPHMCWAITVKGEK